MTNRHPNNLEYLKELIAIGPNRTRRLIDMLEWRKRHFDITGEPLINIVIDGFWNQEEQGLVRYIENTRADLGTLVLYSDYKSNHAAMFPNEIAVTLVSTSIHNVYCLTEKVCCYCDEPIEAEDAINIAVVTKNMHGKCHAKFQAMALFNRFFCTEIGDHGLTVRLRASANCQTPYVKGITCLVSIIPDPIEQGSEAGNWIRATITDSHNTYCTIELGRRGVGDRVDIMFTDHGTMFTGNEEMHAAVQRHNVSYEKEPDTYFRGRYDFIAADLLSTFFLQ